MITSIAAFFIKYAIGDKIKKILAFIIEHWRVFLALAILGACLYQYNKQVNRADKAEATIASINKQYSEEKDKREKEDARKNIIAKNASFANQLKHQKETDQLKLDRANIVKELNREKSNIANILNDAYIMRAEAAANRSPTSKVSSTASLLAESRGNCSATLAIVTEAAQSCAIDYNALASEWATNCKIYGCQPAEEITSEITSYSIDLQPASK